MQTRDQIYAAKIFTQVNSEVRARKGEKKYGSMAHKLPVLIRTAGLAQALAFVDARGDEMQKLLLKHIARTVISETASDETLLAQSRTNQLSEYMSLTHKVLSALLWYKRFAQSVLNVEPGDTDEHEEGGAK